MTKLAILLFLFLSWARQNGPYGGEPNDGKSRERLSRDVGPKGTVLLKIQEYETVSSGRRKGKEIGRVQDGSMSGRFASEVVVDRPLNPNGLLRWRET